MHYTQSITVLLQSTICRCSTVYLLFQVLLLTEYRPLNIRSQNFQKPPSAPPPPPPIFFLNRAIIKSGILSSLCPNALISICICPFPHSPLNHFISPYMIQSSLLHVSYILCGPLCTNCPLSLHPTPRPP